MFKKYVYLGLSTALYSSLLQASVIDVCDLANKDISSVQQVSGMSSKNLNDYLRKLKNECDLSKKYKNLNSELQSEFDVKLTDISEYQAIRFVQRSWLEGSAAAQKPVEVTYQSTKENYALPVNEQSAHVWDDWAMGVKQLEPTIESFKNGVRFDLTALKKIHKGLFPFYPMISEKGDFAHEPNPGVLKPTASTDDENYWWSLETQSEINEAQKIVEIENETYKRLGLLTPAPKGYPDYVSRILDVREAQNRSRPGEKVMALFSGHSMVNRQNTELILDMVDQMIRQALAGQHMVWKGQLFTPGELAYFVQQAYVRVHPFYEGNGRTSRFLQELILLSFNLPHGSSGDLMDIDALTVSSDYYEKALEANFQLLSKMKNCISEYKDVRAGKNLRNINQTKISYGCRILKDRSGIWEELKRANEVQNIKSYELEVVGYIKDGKTIKSRLQALDSKTETDHQNELARRAGVKPVQASTGVDSSASSTTDECAGLSGADKARCDRIAEIKKKLGI